MTNYITVTSAYSFNMLNVHFHIKIADVGEVSISIYQGIQPQALQLVGGILSCNGGGGPVYFEVHYDWNGSMGTIYLLRDIHEDVLVGRVSLLQPSLALHCVHLGNTCLQPCSWLGQVWNILSHLERILCSCHQYLNGIISRVQFQFTCWKAKSSSILVVFCVVLQFRILTR